MKPIIQFHCRLISPAISSIALILVLACANVATAQVHNTKTGTNALASITTGDENTSDGFSALQLTNTGSLNTAVGSIALQKNTAGSGNTAVGYGALTLNTANGNTALGTQALSKNTTGAQNTATGNSALLSNTTGNFNTADGKFALNFNTKGSFNTASGYRALYHNTIGKDNTACGYQALFSNTTAVQNTAIGSGALTNNTTGSPNTAVGAGALMSNTLGTQNTALGAFALSNNVGGNNITALGAKAGTDPNIGSNNIYIGDPGFPGDANVISIGGISASGTDYTKTFIGGIYGASVNAGTALPVYVDTDGHLGTATTSSARFKEAIKPMDRASEAILALQPVTFRYKHDLDPSGIPQFGLVAEQVEKVNPDLVIRDDEGKIVSVRYEAVNAMLLNEFLKEHRKVEEQGAIIAKQQKQIEALAAGLQKVTACIESGNPAGRVVSDN